MYRTAHDGAAGRYIARFFNLGPSVLSLVFHCFPRSVGTAQPCLAQRRRSAFAEIELEPVNYLPSLRCVTPTAGPGPPCPPPRFPAISSCTGFRFGPREGSINLGGCRPHTRLYYERALHLSQLLVSIDRDPTGIVYCFFGLKTQHKSIEGSTRSEC